MISKTVSNNIEMAGAIIMSLAALLSTWCGFQNSKWAGIDSTQLAEVNLKNSAAMETTLASNQQYVADGALTLNFINAVVEGKQKLIDFYLQRMRPDLAAVLKEWLASKPLQNPDAYAHPMAMPEYTSMYNKQNEGAQALRKEAENKRAVAGHAREVSDNYLQLTILFSLVLFLGGIESKFDLIQVRLMLLSLSSLLFLISTYRLLLLPIAGG